MSTADERFVVDFLNVIADANAFELIHDTALLDSLDERVSCTIVCDSQAESVLVFCDIHDFGPAFNVRKYEVFQADLSSE